MTPFVIFALPRSRTRWLSRFLSYGDWHCGHEELMHCRTLDDVRSWLAQPCTGTAETAAAPFWRLLTAYAPDARVVVIRRPVAAVVASLMALRLGFNEGVLTLAMRRMDAKLDQIAARLPGALSVPFEDLATEAGCARVFEHCLPYRHDPAWWAAVAPMNIQCDMVAVLRYFAAHGPQLQKLARQAKHRMAATLARPAEIDGVTFQHEPFEQFYRDAVPLFREHLAQTEQSPEAYLDKNIPLFRLLDAGGALQTITARSNGRMFGYLQSIIGPSLDAPDVVQALHTLFFASPDIRGLGMKLQRAALEALSARGVDEVLMRAGHRGSGPRLGTFYRRLGAEPFGELYRLNLGA